jgi:hypothetical protein
MSRLPQSGSQRHSGRYSCRGETEEISVRRSTLSDENTERSEILIMWNAVRVVDKSYRHAFTELIAKESSARLATVNAGKAAVAAITAIRDVQC